ncbi:Conserved hypothetical protein [Candidatus Protochlamydia naegleriophila]|uniref:Collagen-like protein n=1 Tax=Candidatus Protochlamydia naegleriophila TaxID=389348 RepID=A0A0U5EV27_9BACT|nr:collagen-like protein [Candidatus Protochlamydia naegleriophila]CUI18017.1 Conserved hypothetical protein [Candidatus Protochlamydia naegleriophila]
MFSWHLHKANLFSKAVSWLTIGLCSLTPLNAQPFAEHYPDSCCEQEEKTCTSSNAAKWFAGAAIVGIGAGVIIERSCSSRHSSSGDRGPKGFSGTPGANGVDGQAGAPGATGPAGPNGLPGITFPQGTATLTFTFENTPPFSSPFIASVVLPDQTILESPASPIPPGGSDTIVINNAEFGTYRAFITATAPDVLQGLLVITQSDLPTTAEYPFDSGADTGTQLTFQYTYFE